MKQCGHCKHKKPYEEFYKNRARPDGYAYTCKKCAREASIKYRRSPRGEETRIAYLSLATIQERLRKSKNIYSKSPKGKVAAKRARQAPKAKAAARKRSRQWAQNNREKVQAYWAVKQAMRTGKLPHPSMKQCPCGTQASHWHHTHGYAKEYHLIVSALCHRCHQQQHPHHS